MTEALTRKQQAILAYIRSHVAQRGYPPTIREIARHFGIRSTNGVAGHLKALERKGWLARDGVKSRALVPVEGAASQMAPGVGSDEPPRGPERLVAVPVLGEVPAGTPRLPVEEHQDSVYLDSFFVDPDREIFALRVRGDSMIGDGIYDGDFVFVDKERPPRDGAIVVALVEGQATVKRLFQEPDRIRLEPSNPRMAPLFIPREQFEPSQILGTVVSVFRRV